MSPIRAAEDHEAAGRRLASLAEVEVLSRRALLQRAGAASATVMLPGILAACGSSAKRPTGSRQGGGLAAAMATDFQSFDPANATTVTSLAVNTHVFEPLVEISGSDRKLSPALAVAAPERLGPKRYRVEIRSGAKFHDGSPVTAEDVVYSFERVLDTQAQSFFRQFVDFIAVVKAVDERTVEFALRYPTALLEQRLPAVKIVPRAVVEQVGAKEFALKPVGSGPYSFVSAASNNQVVLERFADYDGPRPGTIDELTLTIQPDASSRIASLRSGQVAVVEAPLDRDIEPTNRTDGLETAALPGFTMSFLMCNCRRPMFRDARVRQALHWAIDREAITKNVFLGNAEPAVSYLPENHPSFVRPDTVYTHDPEKAKALLAEAGYGPSRPLAFELLVFSDVPWIGNSFTIVRENWGDVGIQVNSRGGGEDLYSRVVDKGEYDAFLALADQSLFGWDAGTLLGWHYGPQWTEHLFFWDAPEKQRIIDLLDQGQRETDPGAQAATYGEIQQLVSAQVPLFPLHHRETATAWSTNAVAEFHPIATAGLDLRSAKLAA